MVTKLDKVMTFHEKIPLKKLNDSSITWCFAVTQHIKYFISSLTPD